ncbi:uncharacterized protein LOC62_01G000088 [Vanrija pseudolonga]|uniref:Uncharacterized protein n=1 Tax=Vanrija pseudolonga TaxID=143232 RepID=A0AAF1BEW0_9TREE|nr:hypothetical protein LOC62_01G000088 [Vanrija pseudolonga]
METVKHLFSSCKCKAEERGPTCPCHGACTCKVGKCKCEGCAGRERKPGAHSSSDSASSSDDEAMAKRKADKRAGRKRQGGDAAATNDNRKGDSTRDINGNPAQYDTAQRDTSAQADSSAYDPAGPPPLPHASMGGGASRAEAGYEPEERALGGGAASSDSSGVQSFAADREMGGGASASAPADAVPERGMGGGAGAEAGTGADKDAGKDKDEHGRRRSHHHFGLAGR